MKVVIYTALIGNYDRLIEPNFNSNDIDFVCFTDQNINSKIWDIRNIEPVEELTPTQLNRFYKMNPHKLFPDYEVSVYVDSNIFIKSDFYRFISLSLENHLIAAPCHLLRNCIYEESEVITSQGRANLMQVTDQMNRYRKEGLPSNIGLCEMNIIIRLHNHPDVISLMELWHDEFSKGVKRDQLSFFYCVWKLNMLDKIKSLNINSRRKNKYFMAIPHLNENFLKKTFYYINMFYMRIGRKIKL